MSGEWEMSVWGARGECVGVVWDASACDGLSGGEGGGSRMNHTEAVEDESGSNR